MKLSSSDLGLFFEDRHQQLAADLTKLAEGGLDGDDAAVARAMGADHGLYRWLLPADGVADVRALCLIRECLGYISPMADSIFAVQGLGAFPLQLAGAGDDVLDPYRRGERIGAFALTEPEAGSDVASMQCEARDDGDGTYRLFGHKTLISNVGIATHYTVFANADPAAGRKGITAFLVEADDPGVSAEPIALAAEHPIGELRFDGARGMMVGGLGGGFKLAMKTLDTFRTSVGAAAVGMARRAYDAALSHVSQRVQFGQALAAQQIVQSYIAQMATELDASRLLVLRAAHEKDCGRERPSMEVAMAKMYATEAAQRIIDRAVQLFGGRGVRTGEVVEELYRAIRPLRIYEGTTEIQQLIIARAALQGSGVSGGSK
jgi:acyl-CoA dehydrogenase